MSVDPRAARWSALHHGIDPGRIPLLGGWLRSLWWVARLLVRAHVPATAVTLAGVVLAVDAVLVADQAPLAAAGCVVLAAVADGLDGAVAVVGRGGTLGGARADAVADRIADIAFALVTWRCGGTLWLSLLVAVLAVGVDVARRLQRVPALITVAERPTWAICAVLAAVSSGVADARWPQHVCGSVAAFLGLVALAQVVAHSGGAGERSPVG